jgi:membrane protein DedA with SNARE-associated domain
VVAIFNGFLGTVAVDIMPLPSTPLFIAGGIARMKPYYIIPAFVVGKVVSDTAAVLMGKYAAENTGDLLHGSCHGNP